MIRAIGHEKQVDFVIGNLFIRLMSQEKKEVSDEKRCWGVYGDWVTVGEVF
jgi:hypothetical protein